MDIETLYKNSDVPIKWCRNCQHYVIELKEPFGCKSCKSLFAKPFYKPKEVSSEYHNEFQEAVLQAKMGCKVCLFRNKVRCHTGKLLR